MKHQTNSSGGGGGGSGDRGDSLDAAERRTWTVDFGEGSQTPAFIVSVTSSSPTSMAVRHIEKAAECCKLNNVLC